MSRYRLLPSPAQEAVLRDHCAHARYVWNLAVEQHSHWRPGRASAPGYLEQCRQLTAARAEHPWLAAGSQMVQQQALRDFAQAMAASSTRQTRLGGRRGGRQAGMKGSGSSPSSLATSVACPGKTGAVWVPEGWLGAVPLVPHGTRGAKSYRVTLDRAGAGMSPSPRSRARFPLPVTERSWASTAA